MNEIKDTKWMQRFYSIALITATWSKDPECKVGAVVVSPDKHTLVPGYNGFPKGIEDSEERLANKEIKNALMEHAEINAMDNAKCDISGWALFITKPCCHVCARAIIRKGISAVFMPPPEEHSSWFPMQELGLKLLAEAKITVVHIKVNSNER